MRREFIMVMVGILCTLMISSMISSIFRPNPTKLLLIDGVSGVVGAGNLSYWFLVHMGPLKVELISITGDADLYVSDDNVSPGYEADQYNFSSATFGIDAVDIPELFPRPVGMAIFGHWSNEVSEYKLQIYLDMSVPVFDEKVLDPARQFSYVYYTEKRSEAKRQREREMARREEEERARREEEEYGPRYSRFLHILDVIFDLFVI